MATKAKHCDVLVIGGGPAGSTVSALLSERGWKVTLLEQARHPRFHIGESLLPRNLPILERLGVLDDVAGMAVVKHGADLSLPTGTASQTFDFAEANPKQPIAFQVKRADFDALLLRNSANKGTRVLEGTKATAVELDAADRARVTSIDETGAETIWQADFLVDASGRDTLVASQLGLKVKDPSHSSAAVFAHFDGVERQQGRYAGNTSVIWFEHGWFWMIPLPDGRDSVGVVCRPDYLRTRRVPLERFLLDSIALCPAVALRMRRAQAATETFAAGNYSYRATSMFGERFLLIGDAYAFLDPIYSTGVYLAMESAERGADTVESCLRDPSHRQGYLQRHARIMERGLSRLSWFIYRFNEPAMQALFLLPINPFNIRGSVVALLAGDAFRPFSGGLGVAAFKLAYHSVRPFQGLGDRLAPTALRVSRWLTFRPTERNSRLEG